MHAFHARHRLHVTSKASYDLSIPEIFTNSCHPHRRALLPQSHSPHTFAQRAYTFSNTASTIPHSLQSTRPNFPNFQHFTPFKPPPKPRFSTIPRRLYAPPQIPINSSPPRSTLTFLPYRSLESPPPPRIHSITHPPAPNPLCAHMTPFTLLLAALAVAQVAAYPFHDESVARGLHYLSRPRRKYGGACVADLDGDGWPDLVFGHHGGVIEVYFNDGTGSFEKAPFRLYRDCHGINAFHLSTFTDGKHFAISRGGANGNRPAAPDVFHVTPDRVIHNVTFVVDAEKFAGRGRTFLPLNLKTSVYTRMDGMFINAFPKIPGPRHFFARGVVGPEGPKFKLENITGFPLDLLSTEYACVTDVDNDGTMEIITYPNLRMFKHNDYNFTDITDSVFRNYKGPRNRIITVAEIDYDNDGDMDLFLGRANVGGGVGYGKQFSTSGPHDVLLENVGGYYIDVTARSKIPRPSQTRGATVGDFNNDGFPDFILTRYTDPDVILFNNGDKTFSQHDAGFNRTLPTLGDMATAVDFDKDGHVDVVLSEGSWGDVERGGEYRLMRNIGTTGNYLLVRVGSAPYRKSSSLHAVVHVYIGKRILTRRVGSPGTVVGRSYIETLHFGLGLWMKAKKVQVTWADGSTESQKKVAANQELRFGYFS